MMLTFSMRHSFGEAVLDIAFEAPDGVTVLFGPSGSGKTSVVNAIAGLLTPKTGEIELCGETVFSSAHNINVPAHKRRIGYVFQEPRLFPHLTVAENLAYGQRFSKESGENPDRIVKLLGLNDLLSRMPARLSGGEKQRVAIGRALLSNPRLILADEPLASLDEARKQEILPYFERLRDELDVPVIYVSHSAAEVARLATSLVVLERGRVTRQGDVSSVLADPSVTPLGAREAGAILHATIIAHHSDGLTEIDASGVRLLLPRIRQDEGSATRVRIAAREVILANQQPVGLSALNILKGRVAAIRIGDGPGALVSVDTQAGTVLARVTRRSLDTLGFKEGSPCFAVVKAVGIAPDDVGTR